jgi:hypothetical protein
VATDIGPKIGITGKSQFTKDLKDVNAQVKTLGTEMSKLSAEFEGQEKSEEALTAKSKLLNEQITKQKEKIDLLSKGLKESAEQYGENDAKTQKWQQQLNLAEAELFKMEHQLESTNKDLRNEGEEADKAGKETREAGEDAKASSADWSALGDVVAGVGAAMAAAMAAATAAIVAAGKALTDFAVGGAEYADELLTMSSVTGMSTEKLQELQYASELVDVSIDTITGSMKKNLTSMRKVQQGNDKLADVYDQLGVSVLDANGNLRDDEEVYWELINALGQVSDETERDALAMEVLGKSAQDLNPLIEAGADTMKALAVQAHQAGYVLDEDTLDAFGDFDDQLRKLDVGATAAKNAMGTILLPVLTDLAGEGVDLLGQFTNGILDANGDMEKMGEVIDTVLPQVLDAIMEYLPEILDLAISIITAIADSLIENIDVIIDAATEIVFALFDGIMDNLPTIIDAAVNLIITLAKGLIDNLPTIVKGGMDLIMAVVKGLTDALPELIPAAVDAVLTIVDTLIDNIDMLIDAAIAIILALADGLIQSLPKLAEKAPDIVIKLVKAIIENAPKLFEASLELIVKLAEGLASFFFKLIEKGREMVDSIWQGFKEKIDNATQWGKDLMDNLTSGIDARWSNLKNKVSNVAQTITDFLGFSEPKEGPLSNFHTYAPDMIDLFIKGLQQGQRRLENQLAETFDPAGLTAGVADVTVGNAGGMGVTIPLNIDGQTLTKVVAQIQWQQGTASVRNYGAALA